MRLISPAIVRVVGGNALAIALALLVVGSSAVLLMTLLPPARTAPIALLGLSAALGIGIGGAMASRVLFRFRRRNGGNGEDLGKLLAPAFDDSYTLILGPRLPDVSNDLAGLLVGPAGVRALIARRWRGRYRVRGRGWEYDTRSRVGWIPTITNPFFEADGVADGVARWCRSALDDPVVGIVGAVAFPRPYSSVILEEPDGEVVTTDNAPWYANSIGRIQRLDPPRAARFVEAVLDATEAEVGSRARTPSPRTA